MAGFHFNTKIEMGQFFKENHVSLMINGKKMMKKEEEEGNHGGLQEK